MTFTQKALEAAARAMWPNFDEMPAGAKVEAIEEAERCLSAALAVDEASSLRHFVLSHWDNQDMNHADFRVHAYQIAAANDGEERR